MNETREARCVTHFTGCACQEAQMEKLRVQVEVTGIENQKLREELVTAYLDYHKLNDASLIDKAEVFRLRAQAEALRADTESGFMAGAYARLKNLQDAERERDDLREKLRDAGKL